MAHPRPYCRPPRTMGRVAVVLTLCLVGLLAPATAIATGPAPSRAASVFEVRFMTGMIDHHFMAVQMARICEQKAVHPQLEELCGNIEASQTQQIRQMQTWLREWYGVTYQPQMKPGDMERMQRLASLSGAEFEIAFMRQMIKHHEAAVREGRHCLRKAYHRDLLGLCHNIVVTQTEEIEQMQGWLCQRYGLCR